SESARRSAPGASNFALPSLLFRRLHFSSRRLRADISRAELPLGPQVVVLLCPVDVHRAIPYRLERAFHADGADIDVADHGGHEQTGYEAVDESAGWHGRDVRPVEREHKEIADPRHRGTAEHHDPIDHLLTRIEAIGRRMLVADNAAAFLQPFDVVPVWNVPGYPHQEDDEHTDREREAQVVVRVF